VACHRGVEAARLALAPLERIVRDHARELAAEGRRDEQEERPRHNGRVRVDETLARGTRVTARRGVRRGLALTVAMVGWQVCCPEVSCPDNFAFVQPLPQPNQGALGLERQPVARSRGPRGPRLPRKQRRARPGARSPSRMTGSSGPEALGGGPPGPNGAPRRGARRQEQWPGARILRSVRERLRPVN
jgi:hypothetical protein